MGCASNPSESTVQTARLSVTCAFSQRTPTRRPHAVYVGVTLGLRRGQRLAETLSLSLYNGWVKVGNPAGHIVSCCYGKSLFKSPSTEFIHHCCLDILSFFNNPGPLRDLTRKFWTGMNRYNSRIVIDNIGAINFLLKLRIKSYFRFRDFIIDRSIDWQGSSNVWQCVSVGVCLK